MSDLQPPVVETVQPPAPRQLKKLDLLWQFMRKYPAQLGAAAVALLVASASTLAIPAAFRLIVDNGFGAGDPQDITPYFLGMLGIVMVLGLATAVRFYFVTWLGERVVADVRIAAHSHLLTLSPVFFEENRPAEIAARLTSDTTIIEQVIGTTLSVALRNSITVIGGAALLFLTSPKHAALLLLVIPVTIIPIIVMGRRVRLLSRSSQDRIAELGAMADEALGGLQIVQAFTQEPAEVRRFSAAVGEAFTAAKRRFRTRAIMTALVIFLVFSAILLVLWQGALDVIAGNLTGGQITSFVLWAAMVAGGFGSLTEVFGDVMRAAGAAGRLRELLTTDPQIRSPEQPVALPEPPMGALELRNVSFAYPSKPGQPALEDICLTIAPGETVAIVGPSGAGKSTLFQLIQRFFDPASGEILLDGVPIREADLIQVRKRLAVVPQHTMIFAASARDNIRYGRPQASNAELAAAIEAAHASRFLSELPNGLDTYLGESGLRLSGGQRQRLAIARAILRDAPLLLLDEATSALDTESERLVQSALDRLMEGRTTLVIAHRLSTVINADRIVVLDQGRIVDQGRHDALISKGGLYAKLARLQFESAAAAE